MFTETLKQMVFKIAEEDLPWLRSVLTHAGVKEEQEVAQRLACFKPWSEHSGLL